MKNLEVLFFSKLYPHEMAEEVYTKSHGVMQDAANNFQWKIIEVLDSNLIKPLRIFNMLPIGSFPKY